MGYRPVDTEYELQFADPKFRGLKVVCGSLSVSALLDLMRLARAATEDPEAAVKLFSTFSDSLVEWNLEDSHGPVPATFEGVCSQKLDFILTIIKTWQEAHTEVAPPLPEGSNSGGPAPEALMRELASLSRNHQS